MNRSLRMLVGPVACALALLMAAGCSSSSSGKTFPTIPPGPTVTRVSPQASAGKPLPATPVGCSMASSEQVKALLGVSATPKEQPSRPIYKACNWSGSRSRSFSLSVIRLGNGQVGFTYAKIRGFKSTAVSGLGSRAVYLSGVSNGANVAILAADQGSISVSVSATWAGTLPNAESLQTNLTTLIRSIFTQLGA